MSDITIPPEAWNAYCAALQAGEGDRDACLAMLKAWPGLIHYRGGWEPVINNHARKPHFILPLTQEPTNDK